MKADRNTVYKAIDSERDYQDANWGRDLSGGRAPLEHHGMPGGWRSLDEFVLYMQGYMADAVHSASHCRNRLETLNSIRKVAALAVACMEQHGAPKR